MEYFIEFKSVVYEVDHSVDPDLPLIQFGRVDAMQAAVVRVLHHPGPKLTTLVQEYDWHIKDHLPWALHFDFVNGLIVPFSPRPDTTILKYELPFTQEEMHAAYLAFQRYGRLGFSVGWFDNGEVRQIFQTMIDPQNVQFDLGTEEAVAHLLSFAKN